MFEYLKVLIILINFAIIGYLGVGLMLASFLVFLGKENPGVFEDKKTIFYGFKIDSVKLFLLYLLFWPICVLWIFYNLLNNFLKAW